VNPVAEIAAGGDLTVALLYSNPSYSLLYGWGVGGSQPRMVYGPGRIVQLAVGGSSSGFCTGHHICARLSDGTVQCTGSNSHGELGNGTTTDSPTFVPVQGLTDVVSVSAGACHTCAMRRDGTASCWGFNDNGQLGDGTTLSRSTPTPIRFTRRPLQIVAGYSSTCAVLAGRTVRESSLACWGANGASRTVGLPSGDAYNPIPTLVAGVGAVSSVSLGRGFGCAQLVVGGMQCWGNNDDGQLAIGEFTTGIGRIGQEVEGEGAVSLGDAHGCGVWSDGTVRCWGSNQYGQLGDGSGNSSAVSVVMSGPGTWSVPLRP
jgi:alpha-tubulin suppressor-like RCC1 family protein